MDRLTFLEHLRQSRLLPDERLVELAGRFGEDEPAHALANALVEEGVLTRYQARQLWAGKSKGLVLGQYRILEELGKGGFGHVFKAVHAMMERVVALKVIAPELVEDSRARTWFRREVLASTPLNHPNIVMAYDADEIDEVLFLAMEYIDGPNLDQLVQQRGPLPFGLACEMMRQAALALQHAHAQGMVHRDIKPANLLVPGGAGPEPGGARHGAETAPERVLIKVADFGLARLHRTSAAGTLVLQSEKSCLGTPDYISPEQARNVHDVDIRSDLYSLGCTLYYALTGRRPFQGTTVLEIIVKHLEKEPEPLENLRPDTSLPLRVIVRRLMAKDPDDRYQTPADLIAALAPYCDAEARTDSAALGGALSGADIRARPPLGATGLVPQLAFWDGPVISRPTADVSRPDEGNSEPNTPDKPLPRQERARTPEVIDLPPTSLILPLSRELPAPVPGRGPVAEPAAAKQESPARPYRPEPAVCRLWREWLGVIEALIERGRLVIDEMGYRALHSSLLAECRASGGDGEGRPPVLKRLEAVVEPWLTPQALIPMDRETLSSLLLRCRQVDADLCGRARAGVWSYLALAFLVAVAAGIAGYFLQQQRWAASLRPIYAFLKGFVAVHPYVSLGIAVPAVVLSVILLLSRLLRS